MILSSFEVEVEVEDDDDDNLLVDDEDDDDNVPFSLPLRISSTVRPL